LAAGLRSDPLGELKRSPRPPSRNKGGLFLRGGEGREGEGKGTWMEGERDRRGKGGGRGGKGRGLCSSNISFKKALVTTVAV